jgi:hypothetical protein
MYSSHGHMLRGSGAHIIGVLNGCLVLDASHTPREQAATKVLMFEGAECRGEVPPFGMEVCAEH